MTPLLLDTHAVVWLMEGNPRLRPQVRVQIDLAAKEGLVYVSAISFWEVAVLVSKKRLVLGREVQLWSEDVLAMPGFRLLPLIPSIAIDSTRLPWEMHSDPADRILAASARYLGATLITADHLLLRYATEGGLRCLQAE